MNNPWIYVARVLIPIEGAAGMVLNAALLFYLVRTNKGQAARLYYYSCIVTAILNFYTAFGIMVTIDLPAIIDGKIIAIFYGPVLFYFSKWANDVICLAFFAQVHTMWQSLPAPSILQWLALSKSDRSDITKMLLAYSIPLAFNLLAWGTMPGFLPTDELREEMAISVHKVHGTNLSDFHIFGVRVKDENHFDGLDLALFDIMPSFLVSYAIFAMGAVKIRAKLVTLGASISKRTKQMQLRFLLTQIAQVFLPLVMTSVPLGVLCGAALMGKELHNFPFFMAFMMWPMPAFTALLNLGFVRKTAMNRTPSHSKTSQSKISVAPHGKLSTSQAPTQEYSLLSSNVTLQSANYIIYANGASPVANTEMAEDESSNDISSLVESISQLGIYESVHSTSSSTDKEVSKDDAGCSSALEGDGLPDHGVKRHDFLLAVPKGMCGICFESIQIKRSLKLHPCGHEFHRTCIVEWFETHILYIGKEEGPYQCVTCRAPCEDLKDRTKMQRNLTTYAAWGPSGQPDEMLVISTLCSDDVVHMETFLKFSFNNTVNWIRSLSMQKRLATEDKKSEVYIQDIEEERNKMIKRMRVLDNLIKDYERSKTDIRFGYIQPSLMMKFYEKEDAASIAESSTSAAPGAHPISPANRSDATFPLCPCGEPLSLTYKRFVTLIPCGHSVHRTCIRRKIDEERKEMEVVPTCHCGQQIESMKQFHGTERVGLWALPKNKTALMSTDKVAFYQLRRINIRETLLVIAEQKRAALSPSKNKKEAAYLNDIEEEHLKLIREYRECLQKLLSCIEDQIKDDENWKHDQTEKIIITEAKHCLTMREDKEGRLSEEIKLFLSKRPEIGELLPALCWKKTKSHVVKQEESEESKALYE